MAPRGQEPEDQDVSRLFPMVTLSKETLRPLEPNQPDGVKRGGRLSAAFAGHESGDTLWPLCPSPGPVSG